MATPKMPSKNVIIASILAAAGAAFAVFKSDCNKSEVPTTDETEVSTTADNTADSTTQE